MGRNIDDIIDSLPQARRARIHAGAEKMAEEMLRGADSLAAIRRVAGLTQTELGDLMGINQNAVSQMEKRTEVFISTVANVAVALGYELELAFRKPDGDRVPLPKFQPWQDVSVPAVATRQGKAIARKQALPARRSAKLERAPAAASAPGQLRDGARSRKKASR
ncbi:helix-turn-helix domain-containing protein [Caenimonas aquaedulcis]|uniref:Helix-turn-helix transcriptional regulator n=1 Tax=Caenimonas aquaedulcis TaxID=2793270 RepID=A0A931MG30_9BURK|nr:helix-turn-helix transcriptional regulator [Caenimonas aquaedulcis]MBG9387723.1 helix-turn-helix transcriptional regulator [Caenimonas aquaedulcis]